MKCPYCRSDNNEIFNSRSTRFETQIWRRRRCLDCSKAFTTYEQPDLSFLLVTGGKKPAHYSRPRLFSSIYLAFEGVAGQAKTIDAVTDTVEAKLLDLKAAQVEPDQIAGIVLSTLKHFSMPAFLRYLSKHTDISSPSTLRAEIKKY